MKLNKTVVFILSFGCCITAIYGQKPDNTYFFPVRPGDKNYLSGTMGEIRSTHFHTGIDIKTSGITGLKVYSTRSGYVSRIRVGPEGYGNALYVTDRNGETAVYGHLLKFRDDIQQYTREEQYKRHTFEINLFLTKDKFPVDIGDVIALSGNSGSSTGPHLHFELRDHGQNIINPLSKGFKEIKDDIPPTIQAFSLKTLDIHSRINDLFGNFIFTPTRSENDFRYDEPIRVYGLIGIEIQSFDRLNGAANKDGIPYIKVYFDDALMLDMDLTSFTINESSNTPVYYDHKLKTDSRRTFQKLFIDDGNNLPFYKKQYNRGKISIRDTLLHEVHIVMQDLYGNKSFLDLHLQGAVPVVKQTSKADVSMNPVSTETFENTLVINHRENSDSPDNAVIYSSHRTFEMISSYTFPNESVFLWDLRQGLPDSVMIGKDTLEFHYNVTIPSGADILYYNPYFEMKSYKSSFYDTLYLSSSYYLRDNGKYEVFSIGNDEFPLNGSVQITLLPRFKYNNNGQYGVYLTDNFRDYEFEGNSWNGISISFRTANLGKFTILRDSLAPEIEPLRISGSMASFRIRDDLSGIREFKASINGNWLLMNYDPKKELIWAERLDENIPLKGVLYLSVSDKSGNKAEYKTKIE